jgi:TnsA endonuclease N terminal/TnsA endonuclease C terminal
VGTDPGTASRSLNRSIGLPPLPARRIKKSRRGQSGYFQSRKNGGAIAYESTLERDLFYQLEWDRGVAEFREQPLAISYRAKDRKKQHVPDALFVRSSGEVVLVDVKYRLELFAKWNDLHPAFLATARYASNHGWRYKLMTEKEIRDGRLRNIRLLIPYRAHDPASDRTREVLEAISGQRASVGDIATRVSRGDVDFAHCIATIWCLVAKGVIAVNLEAPLTLASEVWLA